MLLSNIIDLICPKKIKFYEKNKNVEYITANSKLIKKNSIYIADFKKKIKNIYIKEAINNGAVAILTNKTISNLKAPQLIVENLLIATNLILHALKPFPPNNIIGITGTNGKTSVVWLVSSILKLSKLNVKSLGTLGYYENLKKINNVLLTTPEKEELYQMSYSSSPKKSEFIFEASSHGISKKRINHLPVNIAAITNISQDHLDYHKTFKNYKKTKFKIFLKNLSKQGTAILNDNIEGISYIKNKLKKSNVKIITYGTNKSDINCISLKNRIKIKIYSSFHSIKFYSTTNFEIENLLCSICCCLAAGITIKQIISSISKITPVEGRMQLVNRLYNKAKVIVDYAHTPDALKNVLVSNYYNLKKPNLVFGCGGNRDRKKRVIMGRIACKYANNVYITDDNPRNENPDNIRKSIHSGCKRSFIIGNRRVAIQRAIENLNSKEILIIAGKGHEKKQIIKNIINNFDDVKVANYYINKRNCNKE